MAAAGSRSGSGRSEVFVTKTKERDVADDRPIDVGGEGIYFIKPIFVNEHTECGNHTSIVTCVIRAMFLDEKGFAGPRRPQASPAHCRLLLSRPIFRKENNFREESTSFGDDVRR